MLKLTDKKYILSENVTRREGGELCFADVPLTALAEKYGTPLYLYDEERIREKCRTYTNAVKLSFGEDGAEVLYASKAASFKRLYEIISEEGIGIDVVSVGEIKTAEAAGFPLERAYFHSNNKTDFDIEYAVERGIGYFVVDNAEELYAISDIAKSRGVKQRVLLRITPGIDPHTYAAVATGKVDSKFGSAIETGQAKEITKICLSLEGIKLSGFHCHVGSQVFDSDVYVKTAKVMLDFIKDIEAELGYTAEKLDIGGGFGVRYVESQPTIDIAALIGEIADYMKSYAEKIKITLPKISFEPGRSIVADAGLTIYTVGTVKRIPGYKTYVSVDGGMADNPRFALYGSPYTILSVSEETEADSPIVSLVGRCCESGDILAENIPLPSVKRGDLVACLTTGAYHFSMASNYNKLTRPPVVMLKNKEDHLVVRRQTEEDLLTLEL